MNEFNFNGPVGANQVGDNNTANVQQNVGANPSELLQLLADTKEFLNQLPPAERQQAQEMVDVLETQASAEQPQKTLIELCGKKLFDLLAPVATGVVLASWKAYLGLP